MKIAVFGKSGPRLVTAGLVCAKPAAGTAATQPAAASAVTSARSNFDILVLPDPVVCPSLAGPATLWRDLEDLGATEVECLISTDDEAFTYNKRISRLSAAQEQRMIAKAIERNVPRDKIARALDINVRSLTRKVQLLDGICEEAIGLRTVIVSTLPVASVDGVQTKAPEPRVAPASEPYRPDSAQETDLFAKIERLAELNKKGILSSEELAAHEAQFLS